MEEADDLPDGLNPDYLGQFLFSGAGWRNDGGRLNAENRLSWLYSSASTGEPDI